jgi:hypothetical protein
VAHRIWPGLAGLGAFRIAVAGPFGLGMAALVLASSSTLREDDIIATPILLTVSATTVMLASYFAIRSRA